MVIYKLSLGSHEEEWPLPPVHDAIVRVLASTQLLFQSSTPMPTVVELQAKLRQLGLPVSGRKAELISRLAAADDSDWVKLPRSESTSFTGDGDGEVVHLSDSSRGKYLGFFFVLSLLFAIHAGQVGHGIASTSPTGTAALKTSKPDQSQVLLERPPHTIPAATWHKTARDLSIPGPLTGEQVDRYFSDGFLILPKFFEKRLPGLQSDVETLIDGLAHKLKAAGKVSSLYADSTWTKRLLQLTEEYPDAPMVLIKQGILPEHFQQLFADERMLDIAAQLGVGPDVAVNAAWNLRAKMPSYENTVVPWHQDNSYWEPRIWDEHVITVWVALVDSTVENGCMQYLKGGHSSGRTARHVIGKSTRTWYTEVDLETISNDLFEDGTSSCGGGGAGRGCEERIVTAEVKAGTAIIFPGTMPHRSLNSKSRDIRWSTDYRLHRASARRQGFNAANIANDERKAVADVIDLDWFYGLKDSLLLRPGNPKWSEWATVERTTAQNEGMGVASSGTKKKADAEAALGDAVIVGPWMDLWNITSHEDGDRIRNVHVDRYVHETPASKRDISRYLEIGNW